MTGWIEEAQWRKRWGNERRATVWHFETSVFYWKLVERSRCCDLGYAATREEAIAAVEEAAAKKGWEEVQ